MKFPSDVKTIITMHMDYRTTRECYMASLRLHPHAWEATPEAIHYMEAGFEAEEVEELDLDPRTNDDNRVTSVDGQVM